MKHTKKITLFFLIEQFSMYPRIFYHFGFNSEKLLLDLSSSKSLFDFGFTEVDYDNHANLNRSINIWLDNINSVKLDNKNISEILAYENISLWQFAKEALAWNVRLPVKAIFYLNRLFEQFCFSDMVFACNKEMDLLDLTVEAFCKQKNINLTIVSRKKNIFCTQQEDIIQQSADMAIEAGSRRHIRDFVLQHKRVYEKYKPLFVNTIISEYREGEDIFDQSFECFNEYFANMGIVSYRMLLPIYSNINGSKKSFIEYVLSSKKYRTLFFDEFYDDITRLNAERNIEYFTKLADFICNNNNFKNYFSWEGIYFFEALRSFFLDIISFVLPYQAISSLIVARKILQQLSPKIIFLTNETCFYSRAIIIEAHRQGIKTIGVTHGIICPEHANYLDGNTSNSICVDRFDMSFFVPFKTFVFGEYFRHVLSTFGSHKVDDVVVLPNWMKIAKLEKENNLDDKDLLLSFGLKRKYLLFLSSDVFDVENIEFVLQNYNLQENDFVIKLHPLSKKADMYRTLCLSYGVKAFILTDGLELLIRNASKVFALAWSTTVLDCFNCGIKPFVYGSYIECSLPWLKYTNSIYDIQSNDVALTQEDIAELKYYGIGMSDKAELFRIFDEQVLSLISLNGSIE